MFIERLIAAVLLLASFIVLSDQNVYAQATITPIYREVSDATQLMDAVKSIPHGSTSGGTIRLLPGMYIIDTPLIFQDNHYVTLEGSGWDTLIQKTGSGNAIEFVHCWYSSIDNLWVRQSGESKDSSGILFRDSSVCVISRCRLEGFAVSGARLEGLPKMPISSNSVRDCWFLNNRGPQLYCLMSNDFYVTGNQFGTGDSEAGCVLDHCSAGTYSMNYHWGNKVALHLGPGANFNRVENNRFEESGTNGIIIGDPNSRDLNMLNIVTGNTIHTNSKDGIGKYSAVIAYDSEDLIFTQNQVFSWDSNNFRHKYAMELNRGCARWIIKDNTFRHHTQQPILKARSQKNIVKDNVVLK